MNIPRPTSFARPSTSDNYNNLRNPSGSLNRYQSPSFGLTPRNSGPSFLPYNYAPYGYNYGPGSLRPPPGLYSNAPYGLRPVPFAFGPGALTPMPFNSTLTPVGPRLGPLGFVGNAGNQCNEPLCSHSNMKDGDGHELWRPTQLPCTSSSSSCMNNRAPLYQHQTKDILVRNNARVIRASYLTESPKFEADLSKYLDKKNKDDVPDHVVDLLLDFINLDNYENNDPVDEVTLNILATNVGAKSVVERSLERIKAQLKDLHSLNVAEAAKITAMILLTTKVDKGLSSWLEKVMKKDIRLTDELYCSKDFMKLVEGRPELELEFMRLVGSLPEANDEGYRAL